MDRSILVLELTVQLGLDVSFFMETGGGAPYVFIEFKIKAVLTKSVQETKKEIKKIKSITQIGKKSI